MSNHHHEEREVLGTLKARNCMAYWFFFSCLLGIVNSAGVTRAFVLPSNFLQRRQTTTSGSDNRMVWSSCRSRILQEKRQQGDPVSNDDSMENSKPRRPIFSQSVHAAKFKPQRQAQGRSRFQQPSFSNPTIRDQAKQGDRNAENSTAVPHHQADERRTVVRSDGAILELHQDRIKNAGRVGTKRFVDPCKIFVGNLPYDWTETQLRQWVSSVLGMPAELAISHIHVVRNWRTGQSKGYGFVVMTEPLYATICIEKGNRQSAVDKDGNERTLSVDQGKRRREPEVYIKKKKSSDLMEVLDPEDSAIKQGLDMASQEQTMPNEEKKAKKQQLDPEMLMLLRRLDPDLIEERDDHDEEGITLENEHDTLVDAELLMEDEEYDLDERDDDDGVDGVRYDDDVDLGDEEDEVDTTPMNREQRREASRRKKRRKLPTKGFGSN